MGACYHTGSKAAKLYNCSVAKNGTGRYTITTSRNESGQYMIPVASLANDQPTHGGTKGDNTANPLEYSITARRTGARTILVEIFRVRSANGHGGGNDHNEVAIFHREFIDQYWTCMFYFGEGK